MLQNKIHSLIREGEGLRVEFKECKNALNKDVYETVCAFLNRHGGELLLGVNDKGEITGIDPTDDRDDVRTNLIESYERIIAFGQKHLSDPFYLEGTLRISLRDKILRELASNILIHREYVNAFPAKVIIEKYRIYSENGNKPHTHGIINPEDFTPYPKNPVIAGVFKQMGMADELGSGTRNLVKYVQIYSKAAPQLFDEDVFKIIIPLPMQSDNNDSMQVTGQVLSLLAICTHAKTRNELMDTLNLKGRDNFEILYLKPALAHQLIERTVPDHPKSRLQKYHLTSKGKQLLDDAAKA